MFFLSLLFCKSQDDRTVSALFSSVLPELQAERMHLEGVREPCAEPVIGNECMCSRPQLGSPPSLNHRIHLLASP